MQDAVLNLCRVKLRDQQRLERVGYLEEYPQYPQRRVRRHGAARRQRRRRRPAGLGAQVQGLGDRSQRLHLLHDPGPELGADLPRRSASRSGSRTRPTTRPRPASRTSSRSSTTIEEWLADKTKFEAVDILRKFDIPCAPVLSMKEIADDPSLRASGTVVEVDHKVRGKYLTVGSPIKFSDFKPEVTALAAARRAHRRGAERAGLHPERRSPHARQRRGVSEPQNSRLLAPKRPAAA